MFSLAIRAPTGPTFLLVSVELNPADQHLLGNLLFWVWQTFSTKINILRALGHMASVSTLVGVQKVHREPVSGCVWVFADKNRERFQPVYHS